MKPWRIDGGGVGGGELYDKWIGVRMGEGRVDGMRWVVGVWGKGVGVIMVMGWVGG